MSPSGRHYPGQQISSADWNALRESAARAQRLAFAQGALAVTGSNGGTSVLLPENAPPFAVARITGQSTPGPALPSTILYNYAVVWPKGWSASAKASCAPSAHADEVEVWAAPVGNPGWVFSFAGPGGTRQTLFFPIGEVPAFEDCPHARAGASAGADTMPDMAALLERLAAVETAMFGAPASGSALGNAGAIPPGAAAGARTTSARSSRTGFIGAGMRALGRFLGGL